MRQEQLRVHRPHGARARRAHAEHHAATLEPRIDPERTDLHSYGRYGYGVSSYDLHSYGLYGHGWVDPERNELYSPGR